MTSLSWAGGIALGALLSIAACDPSVTASDTGVINPVDAGPPPPAPTVDPPATPVPYPVTTLRGSAPGSRRILVRGGDNPLAATVFTDGTFCIDVPMPNPDTYDFAIVAQNLEGAFSLTAATVQVVFDPGAPPVLGLTTCSGADPAGCAGATEICGNGRDDDCNGLVDDRDPECTDCIDDVLEPNDDIDAPRADPGRYEGLSICPGNMDYYGVFARAGDMISVALFFSQATGDLDMELLDTDRATVLTTSASMDDDEFLSQMVTRTGEFKLRVWGPAGAMNGYTLDLDVTPP